MDSLDDSFFGSNLSALCGKFEKMLEAGETLYYEVDDLEELLEHYMIHQRLELAFKVIEIAKSQYPTNKQLCIKEAELLSLTQKHEEALDLLSDIEFLEGFNPDFYITKASILSQCGAYHDAVTALKKALEVTSDDHDMILMTLAIEYQNLQNYDKAIEYLQRSLEINCDNEDAIYEMGYCFEVSKRQKEGVIAFSKLIDRSPYNAHAWFNLGASYQSLENFERALVAFDYVIVIDEDFHAAYFNKASVLVRLERYEEAIELFKKALNFEILDSLIYFYIGDCYENIEDPKNALLHFEKALKKDDSMSEAWIGASSSLDTLGRELEALEYARKATELEPENADFWCFLAGLQMKYDLPVESAMSFEKSIACGYRQEDLWEDYAQLCLSMKDTEGAQSVLDRALDHHPDNHLLKVYKSIVHYRNGDEDTGFELLVQTLMQEPMMIEEFILYYPKGMELEEIQFLIESIK